MSGFQSPNYTQTPNDLFDSLMPEMGLAELKVVMCVIRHTFGYHRDEIKLSIRHIARFTGLTANSVMDGAKQAEDHGLIERFKEGNKTTLWRAIVSVVPTETPRRTRRDASVLPAETLLGVKERENKVNRKDPFFEMLKTQTKTEQDEEEATRMFEKSFGFGSLPWHSKTVWTKMAKFVIAIYQQNRNAFGEYVVWRGGEGKYKAMSNKQIRLNPEVFMDTGWSEFESDNKHTDETRPAYNPPIERVGVPKPDYIPRPKIGAK